MESFEVSSPMPVPAQSLFNWHAREGAFERLSPPWEDVTVVEKIGSIYPGDRLAIKLRKGPFWMHWIAQHGPIAPGESFQDTQVSGPFKHWHHTHRFLDLDDRSSQLHDSVEYQLFGGAAARRVAGQAVRKELERMFRYRHDTTRQDLEQHNRYATKDRLHVAVTGASGMIGSALCGLLSTGRHRVTRLVRKATAGEGEARWSIEDGLLDPLDSVDAVVHLAGENVGSRWSTAKKKRILESRVTGTTQLVRSLHQLANPPKTFLCASAVGIYGDRSSETVDEESSPGSGFLASVCEQWEEVAAAADGFAERVVMARFGVVLTPRGGALRQMLPPFLLGGGGRIGTGKQAMSWIGLDDAIGALLHLLMQPEGQGAVNLVAPQSIDNLEFTRTLGAVLRRPTIFPLPAAAVRAAFGEMGREMLLSGARVSPTALEASGYTFRHPNLEAALRHLLGR